jgi:hypothetical protein
MRQDKNISLESKYEKVTRMYFLPAYVADLI